MISFMGPYAYPIKINPAPQVISYERRVYLDSDELTVDIVTESVEPNEKFTVRETSIDDVHKYRKDYVMVITGKRIETQQETMDRVKRETAYMAEYNRRKNKA